MRKFDIAVIGGGMVGAAIALGAAKSGKSVALVEGKAPEAYRPDQPMDIRVSAISHKSVELLEQLGVWNDVLEMRVCPYRRLETWEHQECRVRFDADSLSLNQLGYIVENRLIQLGLWNQFSQYPNLSLFCPDSLERIEFSTGSNTVVLRSGEELEAMMVVGADGANSKVRNLANIGVTAWDYRQHCMLINVETEKPQQDITWQWFTPSGPRSFLPLKGNQGSLVWYDSPKRIRQLQAMSSEALREEVIAHFPGELGDIKVLQSGYFPLTRRHAQKYSERRCVLAGDSAHTINPLAGQGVNIGFKDVQVLLDILGNEHWDSEASLAEYERRRRPDNLLMQSGMDFFYKSFSNELGPLKLLRNIGFKMAENSGPIKTQVLKYALGI
ncbi:2-octaprenyl-3-methyl-6-methoxy-1,4-benzoquinol hydroxylase [Vibrio hannami]|uniref:2-octaprenyl-3-methyl-6-methoxy-1,4-benzoquinol hydroxylase n=1 Tax=Vibrio hannami TaxID=2717094 RepID=UPI00240F6FF9|nr:2-octaprenyl-3-methyl-6-methoxy-1,4-benzoquinol hydroxylase [Vibrio hannami]MDG3087422.1 2-octaprenyl-3-methyl-6-methoxy-1,4-benzoquinol hydroxylase [Vibrio hannami]